MKPSDSGHCKFPEICDKTGQCEHWLRELVGCVATATPPHVMDNADQEVLDDHFRAIAKFLLAKRVWRHHWRVEVDGCVFKLDVSGYPRKGREVWKEQEAERERST